ncbi:hypothetical protein [Deinococcus sp.]|uniref:hypothetical protein n=1 Tax=Deinococcus sp. TaxID=47478 RepID=UPI003C7B8190
MTRGRKVNREFLEATSVEDAIAKLQALKKRRAEGEATPGRPVSVPSTSADLSEKRASVASGAVLPKKRGRPPKVKPAAPGTEASPSFSVSRLTAHRPLGLLEVQQPADLDALLADPRLSPHIAMRLDGRFALVLPASLERLQSALLKVGHTPRLRSHTQPGDPP